MIPDKVTQKIDHANAVFARLDQRDGSVRAAARRERERLNAGLATTAKRIGIAIGAISLITIAIGLIMPIGMFGFLAAVGFAIAVAAILAVGGTRQRPLPTVSSDLPNGQMVQRFDSYIYRTRAMLPPSAQSEVDNLSAMLPEFRKILERVPDLDPNAQDARRLMAKHLPGLIDSYTQVPMSYRSAPEPDGKSADDRLVEALSAGRQALKDIGEKLARNDLATFETHGRFIETRYKDESLN